MAGGLIGALRVTLGLDSAQFSSGMAKSRREAATSATAIQKSLKGINSALTGLTAGLTAGLLVQTAHRALEYASSLGEVAQQLGVSTKSLQEYRYAASQVGISQDEMDKALGKLTITLGQVAAGAKAPTKALEAIGLTARDVAGKETGEAARVIAEALTKVEDRSQRAAVEVALFGRAGAKLDTLLAGGRKGIDELARAANELGLVLSDEQIQNADATADKLSEVKQVLEARIAGTVADNADSIVKLADSLSKLAASIVDFMATNPTAAYAALGALAGRVAGPYGAIAGAAGGAIYGYVNNPERLQEAYHQNSRDIGSAYDRVAGKGAYAAAAKAGRFDPNVLRSAAVQAQLTRRKDIRRRMSSGSIAAPAEQAGGGAGVGDFLGSDGPKGKSGEQLAREAERQRKDALRDEYQFASDKRRNQIEILRSEANLIDGLDDRYDKEVEILGLESAQERAAIEHSFQMGDLTRVRADQLLVDEGILAELRQQELAAEKTSRDQENAQRLEDLSLDIRRDQLEALASAAQTASERRAAELRILDHVFEEERLAIARLKASADFNEQEEGRRREAALPGREASARGAVVRGTMGPMESFLNSLPTTAAKADEALQGVAAGGVSDLIDGLAEAKLNVTELGDVFEDVANRIIVDLIRIRLQQAAAGFLSGLLGGGGTAWNAYGGGSRSTMRVGEGFTDYAPIPGFARGGSGILGGRHGYDTNLLSLNGSPIAKVSRGERLTVSPDGGSARGITVEQTIQFSGGVDLATRTEVYRVAAAAKQSAIDGIREANRRSQGSR